MEAQERNITLVVELKHQGTDRTDRGHLSVVREIAGF
jgi:hypothetical protein